MKEEEEKWSHRRWRVNIVKNLETKVKLASFSVVGGGVRKNKEHTSAHGSRKKQRKEELGAERREKEDDGLLKV